MISKILNFFKSEEWLPDCEIYYKQNYTSYYGLCGIKTKYCKSNYIALVDGFEIENRENYRVLSSIRLGSVAYLLLIPRDATKVSKDEYERGIK
tara:strand:- start:40373 stop:40654 length:282 start_codon:yes stop_codon:yes gene_type:complete